LLPNIPTNQYNVTDHGAVGDGVANNAAAIQATINVAAAAGGGTVLIPAAGSLSTYLSGPITLANNMNLEIDSGAMLQMLPRSNWPGTTTFINGTLLHDVEISGLGIIDGQGTNWWFPLADSRPNFINFSGCTNVLIQDITLQNPPTFHLMLKGNNAGITIRGITINTPGDSPNTDGMDLASTNVLVQSCNISDGDDNIEIGGSGLAADITVSNCTFGTGHGVSIGSIDSGGVHDLLVSNCTFIGTSNGIRMKSDNDRGGLAENLQYRDITMTNVGYPITIYSYYKFIGTPNSIRPDIAAAQPVAPVTSLTPIWQNILISNLTVTATTGSHISGIIWGRSEMLVSNVTLCQVNIASPSNTFDIYNAQGIQIVDSNLGGLLGTNTLTLYNAQITVTNSAPNANLVTMGGLAIPPINNILALYNAQAGVSDSSIFGPNPFLTVAQSTLAMENDLNLDGASTLNFGLGTNATEIAVSGNLTLGGTLNVADAGGFAAGIYTLFTYSGVLIDNGLTIGTTPSTNFTYAVSTNTLGQIALVVGNSTPPQDPLVTWQSNYFGCTICPQAQPDADPLGIGMSNTNKFMAGFNPTNPSAYLHIISIAKSGPNATVTYLGASGDSSYSPGVASRTNVLEYSAGAANGSYENSFTTTGQTNILSGGAGLGSVTNMTDVGGATNVPSRYYRVRVLLP
jgi:polygalacturonase